MIVIVNKGGKFHWGLLFASFLPYLFFIGREVGFSKFYLLQYSLFRKKLEKSTRHYTCDKRIKKEEKKGQGERKYGQKGDDIAEDLQTNTIIAKVNAPLIALNTWVWGSDRVAFGYHKETENQNK